MTDSEKEILQEQLSNLHYRSKVKDNETIIVQPTECESIIAILEASNIDFICEKY